jgi:hypothetical protein
MSVFLTWPGDIVLNASQGSTYYNSGDGYANYTSGGK